MQNEIDLELTINTTNIEIVQEDIVVDLQMTGPPGPGYLVTSLTLTNVSNTYTPQRVSNYNIELIYQPLANFTIAAPTGLPINGDVIIFRILSGATNYVPTFNSVFLSSGIAPLPTFTVANKTITVGVQYNSTVSKWVCMATDLVGY
jgi:hypothetical protein